ncbi:YkvR family protein [Mammaliicoccus sciuri]|uniref:YkvR family protein n=1 Tax=Mammaliicoccus sciuri TaxID=1296 RepID=UPI0021D2F45D|nr:YkvR family protein [Mammaliicoccus sciuri]UXV32425.1 YkvR family protein [Mammaliicoccus sciuri]
MVENIYLDETKIPLTFFEDETVDGLYKVTIEFNVTSEAYHDIAVLLYRGRFDVEVPDKDKQFKGEIYNYSTSLTNLYKDNQVAVYHLVLKEIREDQKG